MLKDGIAPSNFTLSIMVKMLNRARKFEQAFSLVEEITGQYKFKANVHVYTNLMQGCIASRQLSRAMAVLETMVKERVYPDCRTYGILIRASLYEESYQQADALLRSALGLPGASVQSACYTIDSSLVKWGCAKSLAAPLLADIKKHKIKVNIDQDTQRRVTMVGVTGESPSTPWTSHKGKGRGQRNAW